MAVPTLPGVTPKTITTHRITTRVLFSGSDDGIPVLFLHGNASSATYWEEIMLALPAGYRAIAPDQRAYGDSDPTKKIDATRGMGDLADDALALLDTLALDKVPSRRALARRLGDLAASDRCAGTLPDGDAGLPRLALRLQRIEGSGRNTLLRRLRRLRWWHRQRRVRPAHGGGRPLDRQPAEFAAHRHEHLLLETAVRPGTRGRLALVAALGARRTGRLSRRFRSRPRTGPSSNRACSVPRTAYRPNTAAT